MKKLFLSCLMLSAALCPAVSQQTEKLGRGLVAVKTDAGVYLSWRCLTSDKVRWAMTSIATALRLTAR